MRTYLPLLASLVALLIGLAVGKAWERYKLSGGRWIDRRRARESPHYILGLNFLVTNQIDLAIEELNKAAMEHVVYVPTGFFKGYQAWRKNVSGIVKAPFPVFWDVKKA